MEARMRRLGVVAALSALAAGCSGAPRASWADQQACWIETAEGQAPTPDLWMGFLLRGLDPRTRQATTPAIDCLGNQVIWDGPGLACSDNSLARALLPGRPLAADDVVVSPVGEGTSLVWVMTNRYASGEAMGPVALVTAGRREQVARVLGTLRAFAVRPRLRLERLGEVDLLVAEGERCGGEGAAVSCERGLRLMSIRGNRFVPETVLSEAGACETPGFLFLMREESEPLPSGWRRRHELNASVAFGPAAIAVQELLVIRDADPRTPASPGRVFRRAEDQLSISWKNGRLAASSSSLWSRMRGRAAP
jgi:hypothetical protein